LAIRAFQELADSKAVSIISSPIDEQRETDRRFSASPSNVFSSIFQGA